VFAKYKFSALTLGAIYEDISPDDFASLDREAYGLQAQYTVVPRWNLAAQWNHAEESEAGDDEADQYSVGVFHSLSDSVLLHAMYTVTKNGDTAAYRGVDYAHGDKVGTLAGRDPWAVAIGATLEFGTPFPTVCAVFSGHPPRCPGGVETLRGGRSPHRRRGVECSADDDTACRVLFCAGLWPALFYDHRPWRSPFGPSRSNVKNCSRQFLTLQ